MADEESNVNNGDGGEGRSAKRSKVAIVPVYRSSYGPAPKEYLEENKASIVFDVHNFADLDEKRGKCVVSQTAQVCNHSFHVEVYPRGDNLSNTDVEYVSLYLSYLGNNSKSNPVNTRVRFKTKNKSTPWGQANFCADQADIGNYQGCMDFRKRSDAIENDLDQDGTFTIEMDIIIGSEKKTVWYPSLPPSDIFRSQLYGSTMSSDVLFIVSASRKKFIGHKCMVELRAKALHELIISTEEASSKTSNSSEDPVIVLPDIDADAFEALLLFIYKDTLPTITTNYMNKNDRVGNDTADDTGDGDFEKVKAIVCVADQFGCTDLKLYMESMLVDKFVSASTAIELLLFADARSCALLKEACMNTYVADANTVTNANPEAWTQLTESNALLVELLTYATSERKIYVPVVVPNKANDKNNQGTSTTSTNEATPTGEDTEDFDVTSLREHLVDKNLDCDGSREILLHRWNDYVRITTSSSTTDTN